MAKGFIDTAGHVMQILTSLHSAVETSKDVINLQKKLNKGEFDSHLWENVLYGGAQILIIPFSLLALMDLLSS